MTAAPDVLLAAEAAAEAEAALVAALPVDPALLGCVLQAAAAVYTAAGAGDMAGAAAAYAEAAQAAGYAFTPGSQLGRAMAVILARVARENGIRAGHRRRRTRGMGLVTA